MTSCHEIFSYVLLSGFCVRKPLQYSILFIFFVRKGSERRSLEEFGPIIIETGRWRVNHDVDEQQQKEWSQKHCRIDTRKIALDNL